jgi:hypothetical protein
MAHNAESVATPIDSAEPIARVVATLRKGQYVRMSPTDENATWSADMASAPVVDATRIYQNLVAQDDPVAIYEDHPCITPPWREAAICYVNEHGNVIVMAAHAFDARDFGGFKAYVSKNGSVLINGLADGKQIPEDHAPYEPLYWKTAEPVDWDDVRWILNTFVFVGGRSPARGPLPTRGPAHAWQFAIAENGEPLDLHWVHLVPEYPLKHWDMAHLVLLGALNFANCRNIEIVEPKRHRAEQRRLDRHGVRISTIQIRPIGRSSRSAKRDDPLGLTPLTSVRGHFACYGPDYGRGLLFGKYAGRFWIPQHARGNSEEGVSVNNYELVP